MLQNACAKPIAQPNNQPPNPQSSIVEPAPAAVPGVPIEAAPAAVPRVPIGDWALRCTAILNIARERAGSAIPQLGAGTITDTVGPGPDPEYFEEARFIGYRVTIDGARYTAGIALSTARDAHRLQARYDDWHRDPLDDAPVGPQIVKHFSDGTNWSAATIATAWSATYWQEFVNAFKPAIDECIDVARIRGASK